MEFEGGCGSGWGLGGSPDGEDEVLHGVSEGLGVRGQQLPGGRIFGVSRQALGRGEQAAG